MALKENSRITKEIILETIRSNRPSISEQELKKYLSIREGINQNNSKTGKPKIGF